MASFQSPFTAYLAESKGSRSYLFPELASFACLALSALLGVIENPISLYILTLGIALALWTYLTLFFEESKVSLFTDS